MVFPMVQALDNPIVLMELLQTPEGRQAAAVMLSQAGVTPEKFESKVLAASETVEPAATQPPAPPQALSSPQPQTQGVDPMTAIGAALATRGTGAAVQGAGGGSSIMSMLPSILGGVQGIAGQGSGGPQPLQPPGAVAPLAGNTGALNPAQIQAILQMALGTAPQQAAQVPTLGQLFAGGGIA